MKVLVEGTHHADAVFDLGIITVMLARGDGLAGAEVNFVAEEGEGSSETFTQFALDRFQLADRATAKLRGDGRQAFVRQILGQAERHDGDGFDVRIIGGQVVDCAAEDCAVVDFGAEDDLGVNLDAGIRNKVKKCLRYKRIVRSIKSPAPSGVSERRWASKSAGVRCMKIDEA